MIKCSKCQEMFDPSVDQFGTITENEIEFSFSVCPKCGHHYLYLVTDPDLRTGIGLYREICEKIAANRAQRREYNLAMEYHRRRLREQNERRLKDLRTQHEARFARLVGDPRE